jgi:uncharacterized protein (TIGR03437 family)
MIKSRPLIIATSVMMIAMPHVFGQSSLTLVGSVPGFSVPLGFAPAPNYSAVNRISLAPGQIVTLQVTGLKTVLPVGQIIRATTVPLPTTLLGISVTISQVVRGGTNVIEPAPVVALSQVNYCSSSATASGCVNNVTYVTVQIPFELLSAVPTQIGISDNGQDFGPFDATPTTDNVHVVTTCDTGAVFSNCQAVATHADGSLVSASSPAKASEVIVIYAFGLGQTTPAVKTGSATPTPAPVLDPASRLGSGRTLELQYDFRPNAEPSRPFNVLTGVISTTPPTAPVILLSPLFVGLTPGQVGLYQINVQLPSAFPAAVWPCTTLSVCTGNPAFCPLPIQSNLTIDIGGISSFDGAAICIQPGAVGL